MDDVSAAKSAVYYHQDVSLKDSSLAKQLQKMLQFLEFCRRRCQMMVQEDDHHVPTKLVCYIVN
jgi:hypothetical protein